MNPREFCRERGYTTTILLTYDFDALFFERIALRELWTGDSGDILVLADARRLTETVQRWHGQLQHMGRRYQLILPTSSSKFHPKMMLRFGRDGGAVWLGSGNQTFGGWGGNQELCCAWTFGPGKRDTGGWMPRLLQRIHSWCPSGLQYDIIRRATELPWLQSMPTEEPLGSETILTSYRGFTLASQLKQRWSGRRFTHVRIFTGSTDEDGAFLAHLHRDFGIESSLIILEESRASFKADQLIRLPLETRVMKLPRSLPMHAKFYWLDGPDGPAALMGSANCSAPAWLWPPESGGNIEAVAVYDNPQAEQFQTVLNLFESEELEEARLVDGNPTPPANDSKTAGPTPSELSWDSTLGEISVRFSPSTQEILKVYLELDDLIVELSSLDGGELWGVEIAELPDHLETVFVKVRLELGSGLSVSYWRWLNDFVELRHASRGRHIADALNAISKQSSSDEQKKIVAALQKISLALLSEPESFPDPVIRLPPKSEDEPEPEDHTRAIDPDDFIRSINDSKFPSLSHEAGRKDVPLSLIGVMRALFPPEEVSDLEDEADFEDEPDEEEDKRKKPSDKKKRERKSAPADRYKQRLRDDVYLFVRRMNEPAYAEACTATQLVQACAYPIAVAALGRKGLWVEPEVEAALATRIFDVLFIKRKKERGLLAKVHVRYRTAGQETAFLKIVGDGTLWVTLLSALFALPPGMPKALALRSILNAKELIASTDAGRIEALLGRFHADNIVILIKQAAKVVSLLSKLEECLGDRFESLKHSQKETRLGCDIGDILWKPIAGWAESKEKVDWGSNLNAHLHLNADTTLVSSALFVNVTKTVDLNGELEVILDQMTEQAPPTTSSPVDS
jgi:hypothetical protein